MWRKPNCDEILEYELYTLTDGLKPAPFLAQRDLQQLIADEGFRHPQASLLSTIHMDDILTGSDSIHTAKTTTRSHSIIESWSISTTQMG